MFFSSNVIHTTTLCPKMANRARLLSEPEGIIIYKFISYAKKPAQLYNYTKTAEHKIQFYLKKNRSNRNTESASETTTADAVSLQRMAICFPQFRAIPSKYHQIAIRIPFPIAGPSSRPPFDCRGLSIKSEKLPQIGPGQDWQRRPFLPTHTQAPRGARSQHSKRPISTAFSRRKTSRPAGEWRRQPPYHGALIRNAVDTRQFRKSCLLRVRRVQR